MGSLGWPRVGVFPPRAGGRSDRAERPNTGRGERRAIWASRI